MKSVVYIGLAALVLAGMTGCTSTQTGTAAGVGVGGALGAVAGHNLGDGSGDRDKGALIGAAVGGLVGNRMGATTDKQKQLDQRLNSVEQQAQTQTIWIENSNGSRTPVNLTKSAGGTWVGPRGEVYTDMPTTEQLRKIYGF